MQKGKFFFLTLLLLITPILVSAQSTNVTFDYTGLVRVSGTPYDGTGDFKLAIVSTNGMTTYWSNDGTSTAGSEPSTSISIPVTDGVFSINVGDTNLGMDPINRALFNTAPNALRLRIWFDDGSSGFEQLNPDRRLNNIELLGLTTGDGGLNIYVDAVNGSDDNDGLTTDTAKATVQAGVDIVPAFIDSPTVITIFPGDYREEVSILNVSIGSADGSFSIIGDNLGTTDTIRITGSDDDLTAVRDRLMLIDLTDNIEIQNIDFDSSANNGVRITRSSASFENCNFSDFTNNGVVMFRGAYVSIIDCNFLTAGNYLLTGFEYSSATIRDSVFDGGGSSGIFFYDGADITIIDSLIQNCGRSGLSLRTNSLGVMTRTTVTDCGSIASSQHSVDVYLGSNLRLTNCVITNGGLNGALRSHGNSIVTILDDGSGDTTISNHPVGITAELSSVVTDPGNNALILSGNTTNVVDDGTNALENVP